MSHILVLAFFWISNIFPDVICDFDVFHYKTFVTSSFEQTAASSVSCLLDTQLDSLISCGIHCAQTEGCFAHEFADDTGCVSCLHVQDAAVSQFPSLFSVDEVFLQGTHKLLLYYIHVKLLSWLYFCHSWQPVLSDGMSARRNLLFGRIFFDL